MDRLREHWEEANSKVAIRKNTLEDMVLECRQYDDMVDDFERWISQMEDECEASNDIANTPDDILKQSEHHKVS